MTSFYDRVAQIPGGARALSAARLRQNVLGVLHACLRNSPLTQADLARRLNVRKSAVNRVFQGDGNLNVNTIAGYLHELGSELRIEAIPLGTQRAEALADARDEEDRRVLNVFNALWGSDPMPSTAGMDGIDFRAVTVRQ
jgi:transcriptional regulator with XRE-family HTH domain